MNTLIALVVIVAVVAVALWLIRQITFPAGLEILKVILTFVVVIIALVQVMGLL